MMRYCRRCVLPDTRPNLRIGADGVCDACAAHDLKARIDWPARADAFREVVRRARERGRGYDCVVPVSGGKDSTWQVVTCLETDTLDELMAMMTARRFRHLPVVTDGALVGIVSIGDVVKHHVAEVEMEATAMRDYITHS